VVVGVPDKIRDEAVMAIVRSKEGQTLSDQEIKEFCQGKMAKFKVPEYIKITQDDFPKTSIGKIRKNIIRDDILEDWETT
jgi:acyl-CoA synthetase (AMP-forming)/AMP-acid ligase II